jgi:hypothetical protein
VLDRARLIDASHLPRGAVGWPCALARWCVAYFKCSEWVLQVETGLKCFLKRVVAVELRQ